MSKIIDAILNLFGDSPETEWPCICTYDSDEPNPNCPLCRGNRMTPIPPKKWKNVMLYEGGTRIDYDTVTGTLYAKKPTEKIFESDAAPNDGFLIINYSILFQAVGAQIINAEEMSEENWDSHPDKNILPNEIRMAIKHWLHAKDAGFIIKKAYFVINPPDRKW